MAAERLTQAKRNGGQSIKRSLKIKSDTSSVVISVGGQNGLGRRKAKGTGLH